MLIRHTVLDGIRAGRITQAFRRWHRPTVRSGGTLLTAAGELEIISVEPVTLEEIGLRDAELAGYSDRDALTADLEKKRAGEFYRVRFGALRPDPRIALRHTPADDPAERQALIERLRRIDARSSTGPWTREVLEAIRDPAT